jgi:protein SCO1/2
MKFAVLAALILTIAACQPRTSSLPVYYDVPEFHLIAQDGQPFSVSLSVSNAWVAYVIDPSCSRPSPRFLSQMREVQDAIIKMPDVKLVSFTVDPARDTRAVLAEYAKTHRASAEHWYFLTGPPDTLQELDRDTFKLGNVDATLQHSTRFVLVDRQSRIRGYYDTSESRAVPRLIEGIFALARDSS